MSEFFYGFLCGLPLGILCALITALFMSARCCKPTPLPEPRLDAAKAIREAETRPANRHPDGWHTIVCDRRNPPDETQSSTFAKPFGRRAFDSAESKIGEGE